MKPTPHRCAIEAAFRVGRSALLAAAIALAACSHPAAESNEIAPLPVSVVARTTFAPSLGIDLSKMTQRPSGLYVQDLTLGKGAVATVGRTAVVRYTGWLADRTQFDAGEISVTLGTNRTIRAWEEGLLGMRVGGRRKLVVPPNLGYGDQGAGNIPPGAVLVFDMELESVL